MSDTSSINVEVAAVPDVEDVVVKQRTEGCEAASHDAPAEAVAVSPVQNSEQGWFAQLAASLPSRWPTLRELVAPWLQLITSVPGDLTSLSWPQAVFLTLFCVWSIIFSFIDFNYFLKPDLYLSQFKWRNDTDNGIEYWRRVLFALSGAASFTGALSVVMVSKGRYSNYTWGWINIITYGLYALAYGYAGDAQMNLIVFPVMQIIGQYQWQGKLDKGAACVNVMTPLQWLAALSLGVLVAVAFYYEIPAFAAGVTGVYYFQDVDLPRRLDATANAMNVVAMILLMNRHVEQWVFWIGVDCVQIAMFTGVAGYGVDANVVSMWTLFLANALWGAYTWFQRWRTEEAARNEPAELSSVKLECVVEQAAPASGNGVVEQPDATGSEGAVDNNVPTADSAAALPALHAAAVTVADGAAI